MSDEALNVDLNPAIEGMKCLRCGTLYPVDDYLTGCTRCVRQGLASNVAPHYRHWPETLTMDSQESWLAYPGASLLGEGQTPLISMPLLASSFGIPQLWLKNEGANPTGSHKDRMSAMFIRRALEIGAKTVVAASSGNAGVSLAAYAARCGLDAVVVTTPKMNGNWRRAVQMHGAKLIATEIAEERWQLVANKVASGDWYPATNFVTPAVGSNPFGVDGYRAIALELFLQCDGTQPTDILVPTSRADLLWGIAQGYRDLLAAGLLETLPRVHAVEPFPRIARVLSGEDLQGSFPGQSDMVSLGGNTVTFQAIEALRATGGQAIPVSEKQVHHDQRTLAQNGLYLELSSAAALSGLRKLLAQQHLQVSRPLLIGTSHGFKEEAHFAAPIALEATE